MFIMLNRNYKDQSPESKIMSDASHLYNMVSSRLFINECNILKINYFNTVNIVIIYQQCDNRKVDLRINLYHNL